MTTRGLIIADKVVHSKKDKVQFGEGNYAKYADVFTEVSLLTSERL